MISVLLFDFSRVVLLSRDTNYKGGLNSLYREVSKTPGFKFSDYFELNKPLVDFLDNIKNRFELYVYTFGLIQEAPEITPTVKRIFKSVFSAEKLGLNKENPNSFSGILKEIGKPASEILFIDDKAVNVDAAKAAGLKAIRYETFDQLVKDFAKEGIE